MNCLLCQQEIQSQLSFLDFWLLRMPERVICDFCAALFVKIPEEHCPRCFKPSSSTVCSDCMLWEKRGVMVNHQAIFQYNPAMRDFFSRYKFMGDYRLHKVFVNVFKFDPKYAVVPVPISPEREQKRGFNQVSAFLKGVKYHELLTKQERIAQSSLDRAERLKAKNTFSLKPNVSVPEKIILVDDIYTTGTTLQHATQVLQNAGAKEIKTFSLCR